MIFLIVKRDFKFGVDINFNRGAEGVDWYFLLMGYIIYNEDKVGKGKVYIICIDRYRL